MVINFGDFGGFCHLWMEKVLLFLLQSLCFNCISNTKLWTSAIGI